MSADGWSRSAGKPVKEVTFAPGGVPAQGRSQRPLSGRADVRAVFSAGRTRRGISAADVAWRRADRRHLRDHAGRPRRLAELFLRRGWAVYNSDAVERGRAGWAQYPDIFKGEPVFLTIANPFERFRIGDGPGSYDRRSGQAPADAGQPVPARGLRQFHQAERAALDHHRRRDRSPPTSPRSTGSAPA